MNGCVHFKRIEFETRSVGLRCRVRKRTFRSDPTLVYFRDPQPLDHPLAQ